MPPSKTNQISSLSNFARNLGGSAGTALVTTYLARNSQANQQRLSAHVTMGGFVYHFFTDRIRKLLMRGGTSPVMASQLAMGQAYRQMLRQASMLSYQNAFFLLSCALVCLIPLPFVMRRPSKRAKVDPDAMGGH